MSDTIPPDDRAAGEAGHIADHNDISDMLSLLQTQYQQLLTAGLNTTGSVDISAPGEGLLVAEGSNAKQGVVTLSAGSAVVLNTSVTAVSRIQLTSQADGGTPGWLRVSARTPGTSFTITSSSNTDASVVAFEIFEPG